jgi:putative membrane protein
MATPDREALGATLALGNALLNGTAALLLGAGYVAIKRRRRDVHKRFMVAAFSVSCLFLLSYLTRILISGTHYYPGHGMWKVIYLVVLSSHMLLAVATPPLAIAALWLATKKRFGAHRKIVKYTWPIWMYVSVTGVLVYVLLYHPPG